MNCDEFEFRMHQRLDDRLSLESDRDLGAHAAQCEPCRLQMHAWSKVAAVMTVPSEESATSDLARVTPRVRAESTRSGAALRTLAGLSAAVLIAVTSLWYVSASSEPVVDSERGKKDSVGLDDGEMMLAQATSELDPAGWWRSVQDRDWVGQTMPAVQSVKDGVAPIGRSLMRAVTILTLSESDQTS